MDNEKALARQAAKEAREIKKNEEKLLKVEKKIESILDRLMDPIVQDLVQLIEDGVEMSVSDKVKILGMLSHQQQLYINMLTKKEDIQQQLQININNQANLNPQLAAKKEADITITKDNKSILLDLGYDVSAIENASKKKNDDVIEGDFIEV